MPLKKVENKKLKFAVFYKRDAIKSFWKQPTKTELENVELICRSFKKVGFPIAIQCVLLILFSSLRTNFQKLEKCLLFRRISEHLSSKLFIQISNKAVACMLSVF